MKTLILKNSHNLSFDEAQKVAAEEARKYLEDPMTLSWLDRGEGRHFPNVDCCGDDDRESWEIYAQSRGGAVRVEVGDEYVFIFREGSVE